jgi:hypothetical protein
MKPPPAAAVVALHHDQLRESARRNNSKALLRAMAHGTGREHVKLRRLRRLFLTASIF